MPGCQCGYPDCRTAVLPSYHGRPQEALHIHPARARRRDRRRRAGRRDELQRLDSPDRAEGIPHPGRPGSRRPVRGRARPVHPRRDRRSRRVGRQGPPPVRRPADRVTGVTYDSGALIAAERGERRIWVRHRALLLRRVVPTVPAPVVAQCWRGSARQAQLARLLAGCETETLDDTRARATGTLAGRARTTDIIDAGVVEGALRRSALIISSDEGAVA